MTTGTYTSMVRIEGGTFLMGSDFAYPEEMPQRRVSVDPFWIDIAPVTNREFQAFVDATGYLTFAEMAPDRQQYPGLPEESYKPGSAVFMQPARPVSLSDPSAWWSFIFGADWRHPSGPGSSIDALAEHPVVHIAYQDALAYADWAGKLLPTEAQWELAAGAGKQTAYAWGEQLSPGGRDMCNHWHGEFPWQDLEGIRQVRTSAIGVYPPNAHGIVDMIGNVWEWTADWYGEHASLATAVCCVPRNPRGASQEASIDAFAGAHSAPRKVLKGGSHLCAPNYCQRYRPAARIPQPIDTTTGHVGFRCVRRDTPLEVS